MTGSDDFAFDRVDGDTPWRETGNTGFEQFLGAISRTQPPATQSPLVAEARELYEVLHDAGLTRFAAAMLWHEKKNDTWRDTPIPARLHNPFSTKDRARPGEWEAFDSYAEAARAWVARIGKEPYPQDGSIREFIEIYAPSVENDVERYITMLVDGINALAPENGDVSPNGARAPEFIGLPATMPVEVLLALFPEANPRGPVTQFYIDYCTTVMPPGQWPSFNGSEELSDGSTWWKFNPLHIFSNPEGKIWVAGDLQQPPHVATHSMVPRDLAWDEPGSTANVVPQRDFAPKEAAMARDRERRLAVTASETELLAAPRGEAVRSLPAGTRVTILSSAEEGFSLVAIANGASEEGYVAEAAIVDSADVLAVPQNMPRDRDRGRDRNRDRDRDRERGRQRGHGRDRPGRSTDRDGQATTGGAGPSVAPETTSGHGGGGEETLGGNAGAGPQTHGAAGAGEQIANEARRYVGRRYVWATHGPDTFDCSGLVHWVMLQATNQNISPDSHTQFNMGTAVEWDQLRPGDILFYDPQHGGEVREGNRASHVGIFVQDGQMVNALNEDRGVIMSDPFSDYFRPLYLGARRLA
jgi:cell wall-associated NlpC family hydrolase